MQRILSLILFGLVLLLPTLAHAHVESEGYSFTSGFMHPLLGPDHLLAMISVGIISALIGGRAIYWVPSIFVASMVVGGMIGVMGIEFPHTELGIALSVLLLGAGIARPHQFPVWLTTCAVSIFGMMHGNAHGIEMPRAAVPVFYSFGFVVATSLIHIAGVGIGFIPFLHRRNRLPMSLAGVAISAVGAYFMVHLVL